MLKKTFFSISVTFLFFVCHNSVIKLLKSLKFIVMELHFTYYLVLFTIIFLILIYIESFMLKQVSHSRMPNSSSSTSNFVLNFKSIKEKYRITNGVKQKKEAFFHSDINLKIENYNQMLNSQLRNLTYIDLMEAKYQSLGNVKQLKNLFKLKKNLQKEILKITTQINYYKSIKNNRTSTLV